MFKTFLNRYSFQVFLCTFVLLFATSERSSAQVTSDNTTNTQVDINENVAEITGGETRGDNLFHSFQDFSVTTGNEAFFNNADNIGNIFSRVTGGNISNIDGIISANGSANLFLINPAGILFGQNASLNIGGSFYGSSASSIIFENGEFSTDLDNPPVLTVNAPIGLGFRDNPGDINSNQATLEVPSGESLALLGGNLNFDGGVIGTFGGRVELGGLTESGEVNINSDGSFNFPDGVARGNVSTVATAFVVADEEGGAVGINANNLSLTSGSFIGAGINIDSGAIDAQAGDVVIDLTEDLVIDNSNITNSNFGTGNAGNVIVNARNITFSNGGQIFNSNTGEGNIGDTILTATGDIAFDGVNDSFISGIFNFFAEEASGSIGEINLTAQNLKVTNGAEISNSILANNNTGNINLNIANTISIDGFRINTLPDGTQIEFASSVSTSLISNGDAGDININTQNLFLSRNGIITALVKEAGNAGNININAELITIGEQGNTNLNPSSIVVEAGGSDFNNSDAVVNGGNVNIDTGSLRISDGSSIRAPVLSRGNGGNITINARDEILVTGTGISTNEQGQEIELLSAIFAGIGEVGIGEAGNIEINTASLLVDQGFISADASGEGNGGDLNIEAKQLTLNGGSSISATTFGNGNAGNVTIVADESISLSGIGTFSRGGIFANALIENGKGGDINLTTDQLTISDGATITASNFSSLGATNPGTGEPGNIAITANSLSLSTGGRIDAATQAETGAGAGIDLEIADDIFLSGDSFISAQAFGNANGGNLNIDTNFIVAFAGNNDMIASAEQGQGGNIDITAESLLGITKGALSPFSNDINASSQFGLDGSVSLNVPDVDSLEGTSELSADIVEPGETTAQACNANREVVAKNSLTIKGKGGVPAPPEMPLDSTNTFVTSENEDINATSALPQPVKTSIGEIQLARGIKVTEKGRIILTAYRTNNQGDAFGYAERNRLPNIETSCGLRKEH